MHEALAALPKIEDEPSPSLEVEGATILPFSRRTDEFVVDALAQAIVPPDEQIDTTGEVYGASLRYKREVGRIALKDELETLPGEQMLRADYEDYRTSLGEKIKTEESLTSLLEINHLKIHAVSDGHVLASDNTSRMDKLVEAGEESSRKKAQEAGSEAVARVMATQARRDGGDVYNVHRVDDMVAGKVPHNFRRVVSMFPEEAMDRDGDKLWTDMNYRRGLAFMQSYYYDGNKVHARTYSISYASKDALRDTLNKLGFGIPEDADSSEWLYYGHETTINTDTAESLSLEPREEYYKAIGKQKTRYTAEELMDAQEGSIRQAYQQLVVPLNKSLAGNKKDAAIHQFAERTLAGSSNILSAEVRRGLMRICAREHFDNEDTVLIDGLIGYSVAEHLREYTLSVINGTQQRAAPREVAQIYAPVPESLFINRLSGRILDGAAAGRSYGGCPGKTLKLTSEESDSFDDFLDSQFAFGGRDKKENEEDEEIPDEIRCTKCGEVSAKEEVVFKDYWRCPCCKYELDVCTGEERHKSEPPVEQHEDTDDIGAKVVSLLRKYGATERRAA